MSEKRSISTEQLPDHIHERDTLPETGTPAGTVWRASTDPPPGTGSGGATGFEPSSEPSTKLPAASPNLESGDSKASRSAHETAREPLSEGEREALRAAWGGAAQDPGDLSEESQYEETRDAAAGSQQETDTERRLRHFGDRQSG